MNAKTAKLCGQYARVLGMPVEAVRAAFVKTSDEAKHRVRVKMEAVVEAARGKTVAKAIQDAAVSVTDVNQRMISGREFL